MLALGENIEIYIPFFPYLEGERFLSRHGLKLLLRGLVRSMLRRGRVPWFDLKVPLKIVPVIHDRFMRDADVVIANHWPTTFSVHQLSPEKGKKFNIIRDTEPSSRVYDKELEAFRLPLMKIVTTPWLKNVLEKEVGVDVAGIVPNGINIKDFEIINKTYNNPPVISMVYSTLPPKGMLDGFAVLEEIKKRHPQVNILLFGFTKPPKLNFETEFHHRPVKEKLRDIYAGTDIFLCPSLQEGYHNPPREAMLARCAVVATNVGCIPLCTIPEETALVVEPGDVQGMISAVSRLINNPKKIRQIGLRGQEHIRQFTWEDSTSKLLSILYKKI